jgi:hypothetical protein
MRRVLLLSPLLLLMACGTASNDPAVGGVTRGEAEALNDAAEMLDQIEPPPRLTDDNDATRSPPSPPQR